MAELANLVVKLSADSAVLQKALKDAKHHVSGFGKALGDVTKIASGFVVGQGLMQAPSFLLSAAQAAADDAASIAKLKTAVENSGAVWDTYKDTLNSVIEAAQKRGFTDDAARNALSLLTAQTGSAEEAAKRFTIAQDVARGANIDLETASRLLGKVTEENADVFKKMGISIGAGATEAEAFAALQQKFGGQAEAYANSTAGQMEAAKIQMGELKEKIGYAVLPILTSLTKLVAEDLVPAISKFVDVAGPKIKAVVVPAFEALKTVFEFLTKHKAETVAALIGIGAAITAVMIPAVIAWTVAEGAKTVALLASAAAFVVANAPMIAIAAAIALVVAGVVLLIQHWDDITAKVPILKTAVEAVVSFFTGTVVPMFGTVVDALKSVITFITDNWQTIGMIISGPFLPLVLLATDAFGIRSALVGAFQAVKDFITEHWPEIATILSGPFAPLVILATDAFGLRSAMEGAMVAIKTFVSDRVDDVVGFFTGLPGRLLTTLGNIGSAAASMGNAIRDGIIGGIKGTVGVIGDLTNQIWEALKSLINSGIQAINDIIPNDIGFSILGKDFKFNLPDNPIPMLAAGGIVTRPTLALIAERGPEAVIPLSRGGIGTTIHYHIEPHFDGPILGDRRQVEMIADKLEATMRRRLG